MVFLLHVGRLPLAISRFVSRNRILCEAAFSLLRTRLIHISPRYWRIFVRLKLFSNRNCPLEFKFNALGKLIASKNMQSDMNYRLLKKT